MEYAGQTSSKKFEVLDPSYTVKILVPDSDIGFSQLVLAELARAGLRLAPHVPCRAHAAASSLLLIAIKGYIMKTRLFKYIENFTTKN